MNKEKWLEKRKSYIGGSDIGAIIGCNPYKTIIDVYLEKTSTEPVIEPENEAIYWGNVLERLVFEKYLKNTKRHEVVYHNQTFKHKDYDFLGANLDFLVNDNDKQKIIIECKTAGARMSGQWGEEGTDDIPDSYLCQVAWYSAITGIPRVDIAVLIGGQDFRIYTYKKNPQFEADLIINAVNFWNNHVLKRIAPVPYNENEANILYTKSQLQKVEADKKVFESYKNLKALTKQVKDIEAKMTEEKYIIKEFMKNNEALIDEEQTELITWKCSKTSKIFDTKSFQKDQPELYSKYLKNKKQSRMFLIK